MKKTITVIAALMLLFGLCQSVGAEDVKIICDENFEGYNIGDKPTGWESSLDNKDVGSYYQVDTDPDNPDNKVLAFYNNGKDQVKNLFNFSEPIGGISTVECKVRMGSSEKDVHWIAWMNTCFNNMLYQGTFTMITSQGTKGMDNFRADYKKWYDVKYEINFLDQTFNYYFDGNLVFENMPFQTQDKNSISYMEFRLQSNSTYVDDIKITMQGGISKIYTKVGISGNYKYSTTKQLMNVYDETTVKNFMNHITFIDGANHKLYESDGVTPYTDTYVKSGMKLVVTSPDEGQKSEITIITRPRFFGTHTAKMAVGASVFAVGSEYVLNNNVRYLINEANPDVKAYSENGEIYVPLRRLAEGFGIEVTWDEQKNCAVLDKTTEVRGIVKDGVMFVEVSSVEELVGKKVIYNDGKLIVVRDEDLTMRDSVHETVMSELYRRLTEE